MTASRVRRFEAPLSIARLLFILLGALSCTVSAAPDSKEKQLEPCTIRSLHSTAFFDLRKIAKYPPTEKDFERHKDDPDWDVRSYHVKGHDYAANFTLNFCAAVVENVIDVDGVDEDLWRNVSAYYEMGGKNYSIGQQNSELVFRGRKLILNYTDGSPCPGQSRSSDKRSLAHLESHSSLDERDHGLLRHEAADLEMAKQRAAMYSSSTSDGVEEEEDDYRQPSYRKSDSIRRKSTILSLMCEKDPLAPRASVSFVGTMDECTYFFEVRTAAACAGVEAKEQSLGPGGVFGVIALIAVLVYMIGGCMYQRTVMHHRGWRQLPNYAMWSSCWAGISDFFIILTSSCSRCFSRKKGYSRVSNSANGYGRGRHAHSEDENRLIDQLDEEWDD